jgi:hypothetical protein
VIRIALLEVAQRITQSFDELHLSHQTQTTVIASQQMCFEVPGMLTH